MRPAFIGIGAQKCASTWIYDILFDHPEVCVSARKEIDFFSNFYDYGFQWYERNFACENQSLIAGEVSPSYFHGLAVPERVSSYDRNMRLILVLRHPIDRAISNHKHEVRTGHLQGKDLSFEFGLANNPSYLEQGLYATHLERWLEYFPREQILVVLFDDIIRDPQEASETVYRFLGIDSRHESEALGRRSNESYVSRFSFVETAKNGVRAIVRKSRLGWAWNLLGRTGLQKMYRGFNRMESETVIPPMESATRSKLEDYFRDEIRRLEGLIDRPLNHWL